MRNSTALFLIIIFLFAILWLPLGQYDFLIDHWMKIGTYAIPFLLIGAFSFYRIEEGYIGNNLKFLSFIFLIAYIIHQFEEHWIDVMGNYYAFYTYNNNLILSVLNAPNDIVKPLSKESVFMINTSLVWLVGSIAIWRSPKHVFPLLAMASITVVNGVVHTLAGIITLSYNPGLLTSVLIFIPLYFYLLRRLKQQVKVPSIQLLIGIIWALLGHVIMVIGLILANYYNLFPELLYFVILVIWSLVPIGLFRNFTIAVK